MVVGEWVVGIKNTLRHREGSTKKNHGKYNGLSSQAPLSLSFTGFNDTHAMRSNRWETSTRRNPETREGITASQRNPHSHPNTQDLLIVFKHLGTREVFVGTYVTRML